MLLVSALAMAQGPGRMMRSGGAASPADRIEMRVQMLSKTLELSEAQATKAKAIFSEAEAAAAASRTALSEARTSLAAAIKTNATAAIDQLSRDIGTATAQTTAVDAKANAAFYALLTPEQQTKYDSRPGMGMGMGMERMRPGGGAREQQ